MPAKHFSFKQLQINKAATSMIVFTSLAVAVVVFTGFSVKALLEQRTYQAKVIGQKEKAKKQLLANVTAKESLVASYQQFVGRSQNIIGGNPNGTAQKDGDNARIVLDALPSKYDFPALTTSVEKLVAEAALGVRIESISGTDDEINQSNINLIDPTPIEMPFQLSVTGAYNGLASLIDGFERSIRPFNVTALSLSGTDSSLRMDVTAKTYYQPEKKVNIQLKEVK